MKESNKQKQNQYVKNWLKKRKSQGWQRVQVFVPGGLAELLREEIEQWKHNNPAYYKQNDFQTGVERTL